MSESRLKVTVTTENHIPGLFDAVIGDSLAVKEGDAMFAKIHSILFRPW